MNKKIIFSLVLTFLLTNIATAAFRYVPSGGTPNDPNIQAAINNASSGDTIIVVDNNNYTAAGFYNIDFKGKNVTVRSASGNPQLCILNCSGANRRAFYFHNGETVASTVYGFTIINGNAGNLYYGGAIECDGASPTIDNCVIKNNTAAYGGAIDCFNASPVIINCTITGNTSIYDGGAIECGGESTPPIIIKNCLITNNKSTSGYGGAIDCYDSTTPEIINCTIANNTGSKTYGGVYNDGAYPVITNSILWNNGDDIYGLGVTVTYSCIQTGHSGTGNISTDPLFRTGPLGNYYLSQILAGQLNNSACVDGGIGDVSSVFSGTIPTTKTNNYSDAGTVDMGFHYPSGASVVNCKLITGVTPGGTGTIDPNIPAPGNDCNQFSERLIHATPNSGYRILQWIDANTATSDPCTVTAGPNDVHVVTMNVNKTVIVKFCSIDTYKVISYVVGGNGSLNFLSGLYSDPNDSRAHFVPKDVNVTLTAVPNSGYVVKQWIKGNTAIFDINNSNTYTVIPGPNTTYTTLIDANTTIVVEFKYQEYLLIAKADPNSPERGTVSPKHGDYYPKNTTAQLTATPRDGYRVNSWWVNGVSIGGWNTPTNSIVMNANKTVIVQFETSTNRLFHVFGDVNGIQNTINLPSVHNGDTIQIHPGTYTASGITVNKVLTSVGDPEHPENVVIDGSGEVFGGINISTTSGVCVLNGLTIANTRYSVVSGLNSKRAGVRGGNGGFGRGNALIISGGNHKILNCIIRNAYARGGNGGNGFDGDPCSPLGSYGGSAGDAYGTGILISSGSPVIENCIIEDCCTVGGNGGNAGNGYNYTSDDPGGAGGQGGTGGKAYGAGIACWDGSNPTFENCTIRNCHAKGGHGGNGGNSATGLAGGYGGLTTETASHQGDVIDNNSAEGGGVYVGRNCNAKFINCTVIDSTTEGSISGLGGLSKTGVMQHPRKNFHLPSFGAGVFCDNFSSTNFSNCLIQGNETRATNYGETTTSDDNDFSGGGGLSLWYTSFSEVNDCNVTQNSAPIGAGIYSLSSTLYVKDSNIINNNSYSGGGILTLDSIADIEKTRIKGNTAGTMSGVDQNSIYPLYGSGGGIYALSSLIHLDDTMILENSAKLTGGGICIDGDTMLTTKPMLKNCLIARNRATDSGGGIASTYFAEPNIQNCTIAENIVTGPDSAGGGLFGSYESHTTVKDTIFWDNSSVNGSQIALSSGGPFTDMPASINISYSDIDLRCGVDFNSLKLESGSGSGSGSGTTLVDGQTIYNTINSSGSAKVIVSLAEPSEMRQMTNWSSSASVNALRSEISIRQAQVLSTLNANEFTLRHQLVNTAAFSGTVTTAGLNKLLANSLVAHIEPVRTVYPMLAQGIPLMNALNTRGIFNGQGVSVAIVDTGVDYTHPKLGGGGFPNSKVIGGYDTGNNDADPMPVGVAHGTCCAGIVAGSLGTVGDYIGGVAYNAKIYALKASPDNASYFTNDATLAAWDWCITHRNDNPANPIMVISNSWAIYGYPINDRAVADAYSPAHTLTAQTAVNAGITILAAAGNDGFAGQGVSWPAAMSNVISVGAVYDAVFTSQACGVLTQPDQVTCYSNTASILDILAPSENAYTTDIVGTSGYSTGDYYPYFNGTSAACPYAAGVVAALQSAAKQTQGGYLTPSQVRTLLKITGDSITDTKVTITKPRVNLGAAIALLTSSVPIYVDDPICTITGLEQDINDVWTVAGSTNISEDPNFVLGYYLSHIATDQAKDSKCIDAGSTTAAALMLDTYTTRIDGVYDAGIVDMGFHYSYAVSKYDITVKIISDANDPGIHGKITVDPNNLISYDPTTATYIYRFYAGMIPAFTAVPNTDYFIKGWYDETDTKLSSNSLFTFTVNSNVTYFVRFKSKRTISISGGGAALRNAVEAAENGDILVVAAGTYDGDISVRGKQIKIYGVNPDDSNIVQKVVVDCGGITGGFIFSGSEDRNTVLNGFRIINGGGNNVQGGAIFIDSNSSPLIVNIDINDCTVLNADGGAIYISGTSNPEFVNVDIKNCSAANGGGIYVDSESSPAFEDCNIANCKANISGGGAYCGSESSPTFTGCSFNKNTAADSAGAIFYGNLCRATLNGCDFSNNFAQKFAGAIICNTACELEVDNCNFGGNDSNGIAGVFYIAKSCNGKIRNTNMTGNTAIKDGGAIYITDSNTIEIADCNISGNTALRGGGIFAISSPKAVISDCQINNNQTSVPSDPNVGEGGGIYSFDGPALIKDCQLMRNTANTSGGGIYLGGVSEPNMHNCLVIYNSAKRDGGGISANWDVQLTLANCTVVSNTVADGNSILGYGGGLSCAYEAYTKIINSILWNNNAKHGQEISVGSNFDAAKKLKAEVAVSYSDVQDGSADVFVDANNGCILDWGSNNFDTNPIFAAGYFGDYYLSQTITGDPCQTTDSQCVDAGLGSAISNGMYKHTTRTDHVIDIPASNVDVGYHYTLATDLLGDLNSDGGVDISDLALFMLYWLDDNCTFPYWCDGTDLNEDGKVDFEDFAIFAANYGHTEKTPPKPDPMTWAKKPHSSGTTQITMTASKAMDKSSGSKVEYYFKCVSGPGGHDSGWTSNLLYTDTGLSAVQYGYQVKARDLHDNETGWSDIGYATPGTLEDITAPTPNPMTWATEPYPASAHSIHMIATTASDSGVVEYYFEKVSDHNGAPNSGWQSEPNYLATGLDANTLYTYRVKARDNASPPNQTDFSIPASATTSGSIIVPPPTDTTPPSPDPVLWSVVPSCYKSGTFYHHTMTASAVTDTSLPVYYYFECVTDSGLSSDWQEGTTYTTQSLGACGYAAYRIWAMDHLGNISTTPSVIYDTSGHLVH